MRLFILLGFLILITIKGALGEPVLYEHYLSNEADLVTGVCIGGTVDCWEIVCENFVAESTHNGNIIEMPIKREGAQLTSPFNILIANATSGHILDTIVYNNSYVDGTDYTLTSGHLYYNFSFPDFSLENGKEYLACLNYDPATTTNRIHFALNSSGGYSNGGLIYYKGGWNTGYYASRDSYFGIFDNQTTIPTLSLYTDLQNNTENFNNPDILISYNGTYTLTTDIFNCSLYDNVTLLDSAADINLSDNQLFNYTFGETAKDYLFNIQCSNADISAGTGMYTYRVDTINPFIGMTLLNNSVINTGDSITYTGNCSDTNLFAYNESILDPNGNMDYNYFIENITGIFINHSSTYAFDTKGNYSIRLECWDSHTKQNIKPIAWYFSNSTLYIEDLKLGGDLKGYNNKNKPITYLFLSEDLDRYKFKISWENTTSYHVLSLLGGDLIPVYDKYMGHFVFNHKYWIDFMSPNVKEVNIIKTYSGYDLEIYLYNASDEVEFESIGELNYVSEGYNIEVVGVGDTTNSLLTQILAVNTNIYEVINLIPPIILYAVFMFLGYYMIQTGNALSGWLIFAISLGFDFLLSGLLYTKYLPLAHIGQGFQGAMVIIFMVFLFLWIVAKLSAFMLLQRKVTIK